MSRKSPEAGRLELRLDAGIYPRRALNRAAKAFSEIAKIDVERSGRWHRIVFSNVDSKVADQLVDEFSNYVLGCLAVER